jgi:hypothetical protein
MFETSSIEDGMKPYEDSNVDLIKKHYKSLKKLITMIDSSCKRVNVLVVEIEKMLDKSYETNIDDQTHLDESKRKENGLGTYMNHINDLFSTRTEEFKNFIQDLEYVPFTEMPKFTDEDEDEDISQRV